MNKEPALLQRLLNLYPLDAIKKRWALEGRHTKNDLINVVVERHSTEEIYKFAKETFGLTKQNVYIYDLSNLKKLPEQIYDDSKALDLTPEKGSGVYFYLVPLVHTVLVRPPTEEAEVLFHWPVHVEVTAKKAIVRCTIMEKDIRSYFDSGVSVFPVKRSLEEEDVVRTIHKGISVCSNCRACDLDKGIKTLWASGRIDARSAKYKTANSTDSTSMDAAFMLKRDRPDTYANLVKAPLLKTAFYLLEKDAKELNHFWSNPSSGELGFSTFSPSETFVDNVISEILKYN